MTNEVERYITRWEAGDLPVEGVMRMVDMLIREREELLRARASSPLPPGVKKLMVEMQAEIDQLHRDHDADPCKGLIRLQRTHWVALRGVVTAARQGTLEQLNGALNRLTAIEDRPGVVVQQ